MPRTPTTLLISLLVLAACTTTAGFEDARAVPEGETKETLGGVVSLHTSPRTAHEMRPDADDDAPYKWGGLPVFSLEPEFLFRRARGLSSGREIEGTLYTPILSPWSVGFGAGIGAKNQLTAAHDGPLELAAGLRVSGHGTRLGAGGTTSTIGHLQLEGRLIGSLHSEKWALSVAPRLATIGTYTRRNHVVYGIASAATTTLQGGATVGLTFDHITERRLLGEERPGVRQHFVEVGWLVGPSFSHPHLEWYRPLFETSRYMQLSVGYGLRR